MIKHTTQTQFRGKGVYLAYNSRLKFITEQSRTEGRNQEPRIMEEHCYFSVCPLTDSCLGDDLIQPKITYLGMVLSTLVRALLGLSMINTIPTDIPTGQSELGSFSVNTLLLE